MKRVEFPAGLFPRPPRAEMTFRVGGRDDHYVTATCEEVALWQSDPSAIPIIEHEGALWRPVGSVWPRKEQP